MATIRVPQTVRGDTVEIVLEVTDADGTPVDDLADRVLRVQVRPHVDSADVLYDSNTDGGLSFVTGNQVRVKIPASRTALMPRRSVWDLRTVLPDGEVETFFVGSSFEWVEAVTRG